MLLKTSINGGWNPYLAGALLGILAVCSAFATTRILGKTNLLGASTTFVRGAGYIEKILAPEHAAKNEYFAKEKVKFDWQFSLVLGILLGALVSSLSDRSFKWETVPPIWAGRFGPNPMIRAAGAFAGGIVAMFGARLADGCPSGHGLSGLMQLSVSGFAALALFFAAGIVTACFVYGGKNHE